MNVEKCIHKRFLFKIILTNVVPTLSGNSLAMIAKEAVIKAALPIASITRMTIAKVMNRLWPYFIIRYVILNFFSTDLHLLLTAT